MQKLKRVDTMATVSKALGILFAIGGIILLSRYFDFPSYRSSEAANRVAAEFGARAQDNYCDVRGFATIYVHYRFRSSKENILKYIEEMELTETAPDPVFMKASPYWWKPKQNSTTKFFGFRPNARRAILPAVCVLSWDQKSGICHIRRVGG